MKFLVFSLSLLLFCSCVPSKPSGGRTLQENQVFKQSLQQPDIPEGKSLQKWERTETTHHTDGRIEITRTAATTELSGTQPWAEIVAEYMKGKFLLAVVSFMGMSILAIFAWKNEYPLLSGVLFLGGIGTFWFSLAPLCAFVIAGVIFYVRTQTLLFPR